MFSQVPFLLLFLSLPWRPFTFQECQAVMNCFRGSSPLSECSSRSLLHGPECSRQLSSFCLLVGLSMVWCDPDTWVPTPLANLMYWNSETFVCFLRRSFILTRISLKLSIVLLSQPLRRGCLGFGSAVLPSLGNGQIPETWAWFKSCISVEESVLLQNTWPPSLPWLVTQQGH